MFCVFFFKQKTAYEMRISDWSSDVCSSDLPLMHRSQRDFFFKSAKIFGAGAVRVTRNILQKEGWPFRMDDQQSSIEFDPKAICALRNPDQEVCVAYFVAEEDETEIGRAHV